MLNIMSVIDDYLAGVKEPDRSELQRIRGIVRDALPDAIEVITYGMPGFKYKTKYLIAFNAFKDHISIFPGASAIAELKDKLKEYTTSKGTISYSLDSPISESLIKAALKIRVDEINKKS